MVLKLPVAILEKKKRKRKKEKKRKEKRKALKYTGRKESSWINSCDSLLSPPPSPPFTCSLYDPGSSSNIAE